MVTSDFPGTPISAIEALLPFPLLPFFLRVWVLLEKHHLQGNRRWDEVGMGGGMSLNNHVNVLCKAGLNIPELHMPADHHSIAGRFFGLQFFTAE